MATELPSWERRYSRKLVWGDLSVILVTLLITQWARFTLAPSPASAASLPSSWPFSLGALDLMMGTLVAAGWLASLSLFDSRQRQVIGAGPDEYKRVIHATLSTFGALALIDFAFELPRSRAFVFISLPVGILLLLALRWIWRKRLHRQRRRGRNNYRVLVMGERHKCAHIAGQLQRNAVSGFHIVGAVTDSKKRTEVLPNVPVVGNYDAVLQAVKEHNINTLILTSADSLRPKQLRRIGWELESSNVDLIVAASLTDIAGPRIHSRPVAGLPLIHVEYPTFSGRRYFEKRAFDVAASAALLILLSPALFALALAVRLESRGPALYRQRRLGLEGEPFSILKFRSMQDGADEMLPSLLDQSSGNEVLFKLKDDPRLTRLGGFIRRHSIDELPQLFNVLRGQMSLVGPRPHLSSEVAQYEKWVDRRLLIRPGITGLWQVSGRSDLSWEDSVRLDLYYVENWSMTGDLLILWRTLRAVALPKGAY